MQTHRINIVSIIPHLLHMAIKTVNRFIGFLPDSRLTSRWLSLSKPVLPARHLTEPGPCLKSGWVKFFVHGFSGQHQVLRLSRFQRERYPDLGCKWVRSTHLHPKSGTFPAKGGRAGFTFELEWRCRSRSVVGRGRR
jgi:hypothetical protein